MQQLCYVIVALALVSIPLSGMATPRASSVIPLRTTFVPFDASLEPLNPPVAQFNVAAPSCKRTVLAWNGTAFPMPPNRRRESYWTFDSHSHSRPTALPSGRSPPVWFEHRNRAVAANAA